MAAGLTPKEFTNRHAGLGARAENVFASYAIRIGLDHPAKIFFLPAEDRDRHLSAIVEECVREGHKDLDIVSTIQKLRQPAKIERWHDVSRDQAAGEIVLADTGKVDWFGLLEGGRPIVENGALLNGSFGRKLPHKEAGELKVANEVADVLYLIRHAQEHDLPQAPWIIFGGKARGGPGSGEFEQAHAQAAAHRQKIERKVGNIVGTHQLQVGDLHHDDANKFRLVCMVFDVEAGQLYVVSSRKKSGQQPPPERFEDWVARNINDVLSASDAEILSIRARVTRPGALMDQLAGPGDSGGTFAPWHNLAQEVKAERRAAQNGSDAGWYAQAVKIWRYAIIARQIDNVRRYEENWAYLAGVQQKLQAVRKVACDDGRQSGDLKVFGGFLTRKEFKEALHYNTGLEQLEFAPHYKCGFLSAARDIHNTFRALDRGLRALPGGERRAEPEPGAFSEYRRSLDYFAGLLQEVRKKDGPVAEALVLRKYLPDGLKAEFNQFRAELAAKAARGQEAHEANIEELAHGHGHEEEAGGSAAGHAHAPKSDERKLVELLYYAFIYNDETVRAVIRRAFDVGVFDRKRETGLLHMPAARKVYRTLGQLYPDGYPPEMTDGRINALVIEEAARRMNERYHRWMRLMPRSR
ncbi:MAG: hypothetical protein KGH63_00850 [Candidatus Micrarchaeota archaeon]|nr:hypothetical protein [Candidatus Micrarchaeota archaeon]